jgi:hypothetical protein
MNITIERTENGYLKLSTIRANSYGEQFLYTKCYEGFTPEEAKLLFKEDVLIDNPYSTTAKENA